MKVEMDKATPGYAKTFRKELGKRIKELRKERGFTQESLAEAVDISVSFVGLIESGRNIPSLFTLLKISRALKIPIFGLFMLEPDVPIKDQTIRELIELLKTGDIGEAKYLLTVAREHRKTYGS